MQEYYHQDGAVGALSTSGPVAIMGSETDKNECGIAGSRMQDEDEVQGRSGILRHAYVEVMAH